MIYNNLLLWQIIQFIKGNVTIVSQALNTISSLREDIVTTLEFLKFESSERKY